MEGLIQLFRPDSVAQAVLALGVVSCLGYALGAVRIAGIGLGTAGVLFSGMAFGRLGLALDPAIFEFVRDFGLILFVFAIGLQVGPDFFASIRRQGLALNALALGIVASGSILAWLAHRYAGVAAPAAIGLLAGATTNTPSLAAAGQALRQIPGVPEEALRLPDLAYAVAYPFGVIGTILAMLTARAGRGGGEAAGPEPTAWEAATGGGATVPPPPSRGLGGSELAAVFAGIVLGVLAGSIPIFVPGLPIPLRLGLAGGPLLAALGLGRIGRCGPLNWRLPPEANAMMRELGITLFLACVGLRAGASLGLVLRQNAALPWIFCGALITFLPLAAAGLLAGKLGRMNLARIWGVLAGSMTDPPALVFATSLSTGGAVATAYAAVYPLTMVLRILIAQAMALTLAFPHAG